MPNLLFIPLISLLSRDLHYNYWFQYNFGSDCSQWGISLIAGEGFPSLLSADRDFPTYGKDISGLISLKGTGIVSILFYFRVTGGRDG